MILRLLTSIFVAALASSSTAGVQSRLSRIGEPIRPSPAIYEMLLSMEAKYPKWADRSEVLQTIFEAAQKRRDLPGQAWAKCFLGVSFDGANNPFASFTAYSEAVPLAERAKCFVLESLSLNNAGGVACLLGLFKQAVNFQERANSIAEKIGNKELKKSTLGNLAEDYREIGQYDRAINALQRSNALCDERDSDLRGMNLRRMGLIYFGQGKVPDAIKVDTEALNIDREHHNIEELAGCFGDLGEIQNQLGNFAAAEDLLTQGLALEDKLSDPFTKASILNSLGLAYVMTGRPDDGLKYLENARALATKK